MSDVEQRARDALNEAYGLADNDRGFYNQEDHRDAYCEMEAACRLIEAHDATKAEFEAFKRDVSEAVKAHIVETERDCSSLWAGVTRGALSRFILPEPVDPIEAEALAIVLADETTRTLRQENAIRRGEAGQSKMAIAKAALRRGMELATEQQP